MTLRHGSVLFRRWPLHSGQTALTVPVVRFTVIPCRWMISQAVAIPDRLHRLPPGQALSFRRLRLRLETGQAAVEFHDRRPLLELVPVNEQFSTP